jgi:2-polyprenyl-3-methyl-5-hydroxy-6-metoxy-1,4-benzoquinol methylase
VDTGIVCPVCTAQARYTFDGPHARVARCSARSCSHFFATGTAPNTGVADYSSQGYKTEYVERDQRLVGYLVSKGVLYEGQSLLDVGSGEGHVAACFRTAGLDVLCVEPSTAARALLSSRGLRSVSCVGDIPKDEVYHLMLLIEAIEHIPLPTETLREAAGHLSDSGSLLVTTPSACSLMARLSKRTSNSFGVASHLHFFTLSSLVTCLTLAGFCDVRRVYLPFMVPNRSVEPVPLAAGPMIAVRIDD